jgi:mono/diheme cytochrome c family protein
MRTPPLHTRARDDTSFADDVRAGAPAPSSAVLADGARQYAISCRPCHGAAGFGGGSVSANLVPWPAPSLRTAHVASMSAYDIYQTIGAGGARMPALAWQIPSRTRWAVAEWTRRIVTLVPRDSELVADSAEAARVAGSMVRWHAFDALRLRAAHAQRE